MRPGKTERMRETAWRRTAAALGPGHRLAVIGALLVGLTLLGASFRPPAGGDPAIDDTGMAIVAVILCIAGLLYLGAVAIVLGPGLPRRAFWGILACAAVMRCILLLTPPFLSTDIYRYVWDGRVQNAGINPYRYLPADPHLAALRDDTIYPWINFVDSEATLYPPAAQAIFAAVARISPTIAGMKLALTGFETLAIAVLLWLLRRAGLPREQVLVYAWHPVPLWEIAGNGHIDAAAVAFLALALLARSYRRPGWVGMTLGCATLVKLLPITLAPALWRRWDWRMPAALAATLILGYLPYLGVGMGVFGSLLDHINDEGLIHGDGYYPLYALGQLVTLPHIATAIYVGGGLAVLAVLAMRIAWREQRPEPEETLAVARDCLILATGVIVFMTPTHPWYFVWLVLFSCLVPRPAVLALTALSPLTYFAFSDAGENAELIMYVVFWALLALGLRSRARSAMPQPTFPAAEVQKAH
ncbi:glycosyltransferase 87 family protein [Benzoatithermus flavus]|uniref:Glycosyltransferase 87 family protein n=1 Tax=Benzoatithermus flavus TaxID=3108223 RepID=A0ABU8XMH4_9PROT